MRTSVIYSGHARTFGEVFPNQYDKVLRQLVNPEFFVSVVDDAQAGAMTRLWERFPKESVHIEYVQQPQIPEPEPSPKWLQMYPASATPQAILRQLWALDRAYSFFIERTSNTAHKYDLTVRLRPDLAFMRFEYPGWWLSDRVDTPVALPARLDAMTPWWSRWGGVNDRFALLEYNAALQYFGTFQKIKRLMDTGCPLHPETLIDRSLREAGIVPSHTLAAEFVAVRLDGTTTPFDPTAIDLAEYARSSR